MFDITAFLKNSFLAKHIKHPIKFSGINHIENLSQKYDLIVRYDLKIEVATKRGDK